MNVLNIFSKYWGQHVLLWAQEATVRWASLEERERVEQVVLNAQEQLLRAKGQVARLQQGAPISIALSPEARPPLFYSYGSS